MFDGYVLVRKKGNKVYLERDILGVKPLFYSPDKFEYSDEKKNLVKKRLKDIHELNPREILVYDKKNRKIRKIKRKFFSTKPEIKKSLKEIKKELRKLIEEAVERRMPGKKFGILFSGGIDSTLIAFLCRKFKGNFTCYTAALDEPGMEKSKDLVFAEKAAKKYGFKLKTMKIKLKEIEKYIKKIIPIIETSNVVKVGVALPLYIALEQAKKDGIKSMFSGLGSEEIFAGYERHKISKDINKECAEGLKLMYERDMYRDYTISKSNNIELKLPFLDENVVEYALRIPGKYKLSRKQNKVVLRIVAEDLGISKEFSQRKKMAAQYGSKFDKAIQKLAKKKGFNKKSEYLESFGKMKLGALFSSGKDSSYALYLMKRQGYDVKCLISMKSRNPDSYMFHTPNIELVSMQAKAMGIPLVQGATKGEKEKELRDLKKTIKKAKEEYSIQGVVTGALFSSYQKERIEKVCKELGLKVFSPLWHIDQEKEMRSLLRDGFKIIFSAVAAYGLDKSWVGRTITEKDVDKLVELNKKYSINIAGEGGEFESLVIDCPLFKKKLKIINSEVIEETEHNAKLKIKKIVLKEKL